MNNFRGILLAIITFSAWGFLPIYWKSLDILDPILLVSHRVIWSSFFLFSICIFTNRIKALKSVFFNTKSLKSALVTSCLIAANWGIYIYAVNSDNVLEASLGYFIGPLFSIMLGVFFFNEKLNIKRSLACFSVLIGVLVSLIDFKEFPVFAFLLSGTMAFYGLYKKKDKDLDSLTLLTAESMILFLPAISILVLKNSASNSSFIFDIKTSILIMGTGVVTALPLLSFSAAAKQIRLTTLGLLQYIGPTLNFILAVFLYKEKLSLIHLITFVFVWIGLLVYSFESIQLLYIKRKKIKYNLKNIRKQDFSNSKIG